MDEMTELLEKTAEKEARFCLLEKMTVAPEIIADTRYWRKLVLEKEALTPLISVRRELVRLKKEYDACRDQLLPEKDAEIGAALQEELILLSSKITQIKADLAKNISALAGTDEVTLELTPNGNKAKDFSEALSSLFTLFAEESGLTATKNKNTLLVAGAGASARMKEENGVHKLVTADRTATVTVAVLPSQTKRDVEINEKDLRIDLYHSGGAGGQNINKVETAIRITHLPTGIVVTCQDERSQLQNKRKAMETLKEKLLARDKKAREEEMIKLRKSASEKVICTYNEETGTVTRSTGEKYAYIEYMQGRKKRI